jgi:hypothetical protein
MIESKLDLNISIDIGQDVNPQILSQSTRQLHQEIAKIGVDSIERITDDKPVPNAKGLPIDVNTLLVTLSSASVMVALIQLLQAWVLRAEGRKVKIRVEDKEEAIELEYSPTATTKDELVVFAQNLQRLLEDRSSIIHLP